MDLHIREQSDTYAIKIEATQDEQVIGWAFLVIIQNGRHIEPYGLLENVYVESAYRGQGFGTQLINAVINEAKQRGCYKVLATSRYAKADVHALYKKVGFEDWGKEFRMNLLTSSPLQKD